MLTPEHLDILRFARYEIQIRALEPTVLPPFLGTTLRGAFGNALKEIACSMSHGECQQCLLVERCLYPRIFETTTNQSTGLFSKSKDAPRPFIFLPPLPRADMAELRARDDLLRFRVRVERDQPIGFGLSLFGKVIDELPYMIHAIASMAHTGLGLERARFVLEKVVALNLTGDREVIYTPAQTSVRAHENQLTLGCWVRARLAQFQLQAEQALHVKAVSASAASHSRVSAGIEGAAGVSRSPGSGRDARIVSFGNDVRVRFLTPTRLRLKGRVVEDPTFFELAGVISLRLSMIAQTHGAAPLNYDYRTMLERALEVVSRDSNLKLLALQRRSNRQRTTLEIDGFTGEISFSGQAIPELMPLLTAGEFIHVGSGTPFGLGRYSMVL